MKEMTDVGGLKIDLVELLRLFTEKCDTHAYLGMYPFSFIENE